jgi:hypothetical protein
MAPFRKAAEIRMISRTFLGLLVSALAFAGPLFAASGGAEGSEVLANALAQLDRTASMDSQGPVLIAELLQKEFGTREDEMRWAMDQNMNWGEIAAMAYIQATTGRSFADMYQQDARRNFWAYAENAGMSCDKMANWFEGFRKRVTREQNSRIFDRLRVSRRVHALPDLGSGFGLFQEALDFRRLDAPRPTKVHDVNGELAKGKK